MNLTIEQKLHNMKTKRNHSIRCLRNLMCLIKKTKTNEYDFGLIKSSFFGLILFIFLIYVIQFLNSILIKILRLNACSQLILNKTQKILIEILIEWFSSMQCNLTQRFLVERFSFQTLDFF